MSIDSDYLKIDIIDENCDIIVSSSNYSIEGSRIIIHGNDFPLLDRNSITRVIGHMKDGIVAMEGVVALSIEEQLNLHITGCGQKAERREFLKVKTDANAIIQKAYMAKSGEKNAKGFQLNESITLRDISIGGMCFFSNRAFFKGQILHIRPFEINDRLVVEAVVLRKQRENSGADFKYRYACNFVELSNFQQRVTCEYVFKKELESHHREKEKNSKIYD